MVCLLVVEHWITSQIRNTASVQGLLLVNGTAQPFGIPHPCHFMHNNSFTNKHETLTKCSTLTDGGTAHGIKSACKFFPVPLKSGTLGVSSGALFNTEGERHGLLDNTEAPPQKQ